MSSNKAPDEPKLGRVAQVREAYRMTKTSEPSIGWVLLAWFAGVLAIFIALGFLFKAPVFAAFLGVPFALVATLFIFTRHAEASAYRRIEGQPGAAASALNGLRSGWFVTPGVAATRNQDLVHRVLGRPGIILVAEAPASRATALLASERRRTSRYMPDIPIHEIVVGDEEGQVPLRKVQRTVMKLPKVLTPAQVSAIRRRLDALTTTPVPIPKGPMPKSTKIPKKMRG